MALALFTRKLLQWAGSYDRKMPWKDRTDAYAIWLSEIILQQTRVEQGLPYYLRFLEAFPSIHDLAKAEEQQVLKLWQGLGYYSRARNLHATARYISAELHGDFPSTYKELLALKGVGPYTAAAIASFAFHLSHAVVDGNVYRVLARYFADDMDIGTSQGQKRFTFLANELIDPKRPGEFNQAIMDLGALVCTPSKPNCTHCPLRDECLALQQNSIQDLPVKTKKITRKTRYFYYFVFRKGQHLWIQERKEKDIWQSLFQFPLLEAKKAMTTPQIQTGIKRWLPPDSWEIKGILGPFTQLLTHQKIIVYFVEIDISKTPDKIFEKVDISTIHSYPFPKLIAQYVDNSFGQS